MDFRSALLASMIAGASLATALPVAAASAPRQCFMLNQLQGTRPDGDRTVYARVGAKQIFRLDLAHRCPALLSREGIVLIPAGGKNEICTGLDVDLRARELGGGSVPCAIAGITRLTPEEAAALPPKARP